MWGGDFSHTDMKTYDILDAIIESLEIANQTSIQNYNV